MDKKRVEVLFYYKEECHLCETMAVELQAFGEKYQDDFQLNVISRDIGDCDSWYRQFWEYVPMLILGDEEICYYFFNEIEVLEKVRETFI